MIVDETLKKYISKCGRYLSRVIYKRATRNWELRHSIAYKLLGYISTYCFNVTHLDLTASVFFPSEVEILAENCKKLKVLRLTFSLQYDYNRELTKIFEVNRNLEDVALYKLRSQCRVLMELPEHKMKAITINWFDEHPDILSSVSII